MQSDHPAIAPRVQSHPGDIGTNISKLPVQLPFASTVTANTPDLRCLACQKYAFRSDGTFLRAEFAPWAVETGFLPHLVDFRAKRGKASFFERVEIAMRLDFDSPIYAGIDPDFVLGGDIRPYPSDWRKFPLQRGNMSYAFRGVCRNPAHRTFALVVRRSIIKHPPDQLWPRRMLIRERRLARVRGGRGTRTLTPCGT